MEPTEICFPAACFGGCFLFQCPLVSVDLVLTRPNRMKDRFVCWLKKLLLRRVNLFIHYFTDVSGYEEFYGISTGRSKYVAFKANLYDGAPPIDEAKSTGGYVLAAGRSHRDLKTFVEAMRRVPYPGVLLVQDRAVLEEHGTEPNIHPLPGNLKLFRADGTWTSWLSFLAGAKIVVIPVKAATISAAGVGTYLEAMALGKCVIITECPATREILTQQAVIVPPEDPAAMTAAIRRAWEDDAFRLQIAESGLLYAQSCGDERRLLRDLLGLCVEHIRPDLSVDIRCI